MENLLAIGCDHAGFELKLKLIEYLTNKGYQFKDFGTYSTESVDYPDYAHPLAQAVNRQEITRGILICGSANGVCITANKYPNVRAAICWKNEIAELARQHNDTNIVGLPARFISEAEAFEIVDAFLNTAFEGGRHANRVNKINQQLII